MSKLITRAPVAAITLDSGSTNITTSAYVELTASTTTSSNGLEFFNGAGSILYFATGASGSEVNIPYRLLPGTGGILLDITIAKGTRLSVKALDATASQGYLVLNLFG